MPNGLVVVAKVLQYRFGMKFQFIKYIKPGILPGFFLFFCSLQAQYNYKLHGLKDPLFAGGSSLIFGTSVYLQQQVHPLTETEIRLLDKQNVNRFDRFACQYWSKDIAHISDGVAIGSGLMFIYFAANPESRSGTFAIGTVAFQSLLLTQAFSNACKLTLRNRPYMYNASVDMSVRQKSDGRMSFFSAHTGTVSSLCFSFAYAHATYLNKGKPDKAVFIAAAAVPAIQGILRVRAGKHFPSDVIAGYLIGLGSSYLMHALHKNTP